MKKIARIVFIIFYCALCPITLPLTLVIAMGIFLVCAIIQLGVNVSNLIFGKPIPSHRKH